MTSNIHTNTPFTNQASHSKLSFPTFIKTHPALTFLAILGLTFLIIALVFRITSSTNSNEEKILIKDLGSYSKMPSSTREQLYSELYKISTANAPSNPETTSSHQPTTAVIRADSFKEDYDSKTESFSGSFVADIESLQQSFVLYFVWAPKVSSKNDTLLKSYPVTAACPHVDQLIYPYFSCAYSYSEDVSPYTTVSNLLPYSTILTISSSTDSTIYSVSGPKTYYEQPIEYLQLDVESCGNETITSSALNHFKTYLKDHFLDPEYFVYEIRDLCGSKTVNSTHFIGENNPDKTTLEELFNQTEDFRDPSRPFMPHA